MIFIYLKETHEGLVTLQLFKERRVSGSTKAKKPLKGEKKLEDVKTIDFVSRRKRKAGDNIDLNLTMAIKLSSPKQGPNIQIPKLQFPSPLTMEEAAISLGLSLH
jgi:hypothetical protein